jgi:hypothetical protein
MVAESRDHDPQPIELKIQIAKNFYNAKGEILDPEVEELLSKLEQAIAESREAMEKSGITKACKKCGELSCCGRGIENRYDVSTLLINLLMGVELSKGDAEGCYFLTTSGCSLKAREVICVNYLCDGIYQALSHETLIEVQEICGRELDILFSLAELIKRKIRQIESC